MFKNLFKWIAGVLVSIILICGGGILLINAKYNINVISVVRSLGKIGQSVELAEIAPKAPTAENYSQTKDKLNAVIPNMVSYDSETDKYTINTSISGEMSANIRLTDAEVCSLIKWMLDANTDGMKANIAGQEVDLKEYEFTVEEIEFLVGEASAVNFKVVVSVNLTKVKDKMTFFPFNFIKDKVPTKLYLSSIVAVKKEAGAFAYSVSSVSMALNKMSGEEIKQAFDLLNVFVKAGDASNFNIAIGKSFVDALIGHPAVEGVYEEVNGFAYSLRNIGATDFDFETEGEVIYFIVKK